MTEGSHARSLIQVTTVGDLVDARAEETSDALVFPGARVTFAELASESDRFARSLVALGIGPGDHVGILMPNCLEFAVALVGIAKIGAVAVPINGRFKEIECEHVLTHGDVEALVLATDPNGTGYADLARRVFARAARSATSTLRLRPDRVVDLSATPADGFMDAQTFRALGERVGQEVVKDLQSRVRVRDIAILMYTSGTTAAPKGCLLTHEAIVRQGSSVARTRFGLGPGEAMWNPLPLYHCGGIVPMLGCISTGAKYVHAGHFDAATSLAAMAGEQCSILFPGFETIWNAVLEHDDFERTDLSRVRLIQNATTPEQLARFEARMPWAKQISSYGSTESSTNLTLPLPADDAEVRFNTLGRPMAGMQVKVVDPATGEQVPDGTMGELCFRGYSMFEGYYKDPELTSAVIDGEGWFHSGDRASVRPDGNLTFGGRLKDMLKVGGENVSALEIEQYLVSHPAVAIAQVVGVTDKRYGEVPAAFIQLARDAEVSDDDLLDYCLDSIATFKVPRYFRRVDAWPMSGTKIQKFKLRAQLEKELSELGIELAPSPRRTVAS